MATFEFGPPNSQNGSVVFEFGNRGLQLLDVNSTAKCPYPYTVRDLDMLVVYTWLLHLKPVTNLQELANLHKTLFRLYRMFVQLQDKKKLDSNRMLIATLAMHYLYCDPLLDNSCLAMVDYITSKHGDLHFSKAMLVEGVSATLRYNNRMMENGGYEADLIEHLISDLTLMVFRVCETTPVGIDMIIHHSRQIDKICFDEASRLLNPEATWFKDCPLITGQPRAEHTYYPLARHKTWTNLNIEEYKDVMRIRFLLFPELVYLHDPNMQPCYIDQMYPEYGIYDESIRARKFFIEVICGPTIMRRIRSSLESLIHDDQGGPEVAVDRDGDLFGPDVDMNVVDMQGK